MKNKDLKKRILDISFKHKFAHLGSCLTAVDIIEEIYYKKKWDEVFVLSAGHAHLAHLVVMEKYAKLFKESHVDWSIPSHKLIDAEEMIVKYGIHCDRRAGCDVSTGSLGQGLPIALGIAMGDKSGMVHCLVSDGELSEGSIWESLRIRDEQAVNNLIVHINLNGWAAYRAVESKRVKELLAPFQPGIIIHETNFNDFPFLQGQEAHYKVMSGSDYQHALEVLNV